MKREPQKAGYFSEPQLTLNSLPAFISPSNTQSFNRYSYCWNNPLVYTDPSGEFIGSIFTAQIDLAKTVFTKGGLEFWNWNGGDSYVGRAWKEFDPTASWSKTNKAFKIDMGLLKTDPNKSSFGRVWERTSRFTWQLPQTLFGNTMAHGANLLGLVNAVNYFAGMTVIDSDIEGGAISIGHVTIGPPGYRGDFRDHLFVHEYGHYRQSQRWGYLYLPLIGIPSLQSAALEEIGIGQHDNRWFEAQANRLAVNYFDRHYGSGRDGYIVNDPEYFDRNSYVNPRVRSPYINPRNLGDNLGGNPLRGSFHWSDPLLYLYIGLFIFF